MGAAASKTAAPVAATATKRASQANRTRVIRTNLSLERLAVLARGEAEPASASASRAAIQSGAVEMSSTSVDAAGNKVELMEMQETLVQDMSRFEDYDKVDFLEQSTRAFEATASSHRPRSAEPVRMPTDRTSTASTLGDVHEPVRGRLTNRELRALLRLHYEAPQSWTAEVLAEKYALDPEVMRGILASVGPPNVLPPRGTSEHPMGVWFESPGQAAAALEGPKTTSEKENKQMGH